MKPELKKVNAALAHEFYKGNPPFSIRGFAAVLDGKPVAMGGVYQSGGWHVAFLEIRDEMRPYRRELIRFLKEGKRVLSRYESVLAVVSAEEPTAKTLLTHLGFSFMMHDIEGREIYQWQQR